MITEQELKDFAVTVPYSFEYIRLFVLNLKEEQRNLEFVTKIFNVLQLTEGGFLSNLVDAAFC